MALDTFMVAYRAGLAKAVAEHPDEYGMRPEAVPHVADKMQVAIERGTFNHDGRGFRNACKALGIPHTRKAIVAFVAA